VPKRIQPATDQAPLGLRVGDPVRERQAEIAYGTYAAKALFQFDLEGQIELTRQHRARMPFSEAVDDRVMTEYVRGRLEHERAH
jgi:hypothetical protein